MLDWGKRISEIRGDQRELEDFIRLHEAFILKSASKASRRFVTKSDDEWSIALLGFTEAIEKYNPERGSFLTYAGMLIRSRLIDWFRTNGRQGADFHTEDMYNDIEDTGYNDDLRLEIHALGEALGGYGLSFSDIASNSPKDDKTKKACREILLYLIEDRDLTIEIRRTGTLPIKILKKISTYPEKP